MTPILLPKHELHSEAWHKARRSRLGASEMAAVLGLSPWQSPFSLWHLKAGLVEPDPGNAATEWGQRLEPVVAQKFREEHPELTPTPDQGNAYCHPERTWQAASPDILFTDTFCEIKTAARADAWFEGIPLYYRVQVLQTLDVLGFDHCYLAALISGSTYREFLIELDDDAQADLQAMRTAGEQFMASIAANEPPDIDDSYGTYQTLRRLSPDIDLDTEVEVTRDMAEAFINANQAEQQVKREQQKARNDIARQMLTAQYATCEGVRIARRQPARDNGPAVLASTRKHLPALPTPQENVA